MKLAMIGLGKMGGAMVRRLLKDGHAVVAFDLDEQAVKDLAAEGAEPAHALNEAIDKLGPGPRVLWLMLPAGEPVARTLELLVPLLEENDVVIDGGNSFYKDSMERAKLLRFKGIHMLDVGVSGGVWGLEYGFNLVAGGERQAFEHVEPILQTLAPEGGYMHVGPSGAGHFVKMVHNGIEYGMMQAIAEGFEIMHAKEEFDLDLPGLTRLWQEGSVIRSWLLDLAGQALEEDPNLDWIEGYVPDSGEGRWTVLESIDLDVPAPVIALSLQMRFRSRQESSFAARLLAALRQQFGGHAIKRAR
jgi:6-phosphogluconate dehydrogenase